MKKITSGFTLVELIIVIVILAILGTIAFVSLQGYSQSAKNSKVASDIRSLISAVESASAERNEFNMSELVKDPWTYGTAVATGSFASGVSLSGATYHVGKMNFPFIKQTKTDFTDPEENDYVTALIIDPVNQENYFYQVAWQTKNKAGTYDAIVKWSYLKFVPSDIDGLIAWIWYDDGVDENSISMSAPGLY